MGISTVSGPFRSKNGFQQLDENGVWVPVSGGGGGGGGPVIVNLTQSNVYGAVGVAPTGSVIQAPQVAPGEIIRVFADLSTYIYSSETTPRPVWAVQFYAPSGAIPYISSEYMFTQGINEFSSLNVFNKFAILESFDPGESPLGVFYPTFGEGGGGQGYFTSMAFDVLYLGSTYNPYAEATLAFYVIHNVLPNYGSPPPNIFQYPSY